MRGPTKTEVTSEVSSKGCREEFTLCFRVIPTRWQRFLCNGWVSASLLRRKVERQGIRQRESAPLSAARPLAAGCRQRLPLNPGRLGRMRTKLTMDFSLSKTIIFIPAGVDCQTRWWQVHLCLSIAGTIRAPPPGPLPSPHANKGEKRRQSQRCVSSD